MLTNEEAWAEERLGHEPDAGDLIDAEAVRIDETIEDWPGDQIRPWVLSTLLYSVSSACKRSGLGIDDLAEVAHQPVPEHLTMLALQGLAAKADDMALIDHLSREISDAEGQFLYNLVVTLTRMQRHRATLGALRRSG